MSKFTLSTLLLTVFFSVALFAQASKVDSSDMRTLRIDPFSARGAAVSQIFDEVNFIPLETTKESLFGSIGQLRIAGENYIIWDYDTKSILIFTKEGKYKGKINGSKIEKDPDNKDNQDFWGFTIVNENDQEVIKISSGRYDLYFDLNAKVIKKVKREAYKTAERFSDGTVLERGYLDKKDKDSTYYEIGLIKDNQKIKSYFPYSIDRYKHDEFWTGGETLTNYGNPDEYFYINTYEPNIYKVTPKSLSLAYKIIFPANNSLPSDFKNNPLYVGKRQEYFEKNPKVFYAVSSVYQIGDNLYFKVNSFSFSRDEKKAFILNLKSNALSSISDIEPDSISQFLPLTDAGVHYDFANKGFHLFDRNYFYTSYSSLVLFGFKDQNEGKSRKYDPVLTEYFKTQNKKSNPVIIQLKPKKQ
ncbi:6-bladed beta-propeller [Pedobacter sp. JCM 36344]|uniref:6-bladed beta-propeller n=1 Tax=Pedobacter sp. JCM 36344 TaxID=3374280 RepID=UPI003978E15A